VAAFAVTPGLLGAIAIAVVTPGLDTIYRSASLGQAWTTFGIQGTGGGAMLSSLQFMSPATGCLVTGNPGSESHGQLLWTRDAGRTWYRSGSESATHGRRCRLPEDLTALSASPRSP
jgi:photosystem II stability/assembly factor-like uncharacterized protein